MKRVKIHVFDESVMRDPAGSYDNRIYKKLSNQNDIYPVAADDGSYLICFSSESAMVILPPSLLNALEASFKSKGGMVIDGVVYHTATAYHNPRLIRWFNVLMSDINRRKLSGNRKIELSTITDIQERTPVLDFSSSQAVRRPAEPPKRGLDPIDAAINGLTTFGDSVDVNPFDDIGWNGEPPAENDSVRDDEDDSTPSRGDYRALSCFELRKAEKNWNKHQIIVADKDTIRRDEEVIREILKDIIPGEEPWKVIAKAILEKRIMKCIAITKSEFEELERRGGIGRIFNNTKAGLEITALGLSVASGVGSLVGKRRI